MFNFKDNLLNPTHVFTDFYFNIGDINKAYF